MPTTVTRRLLTEDELNQVARPRSDGCPDAELLPAPGQRGVGDPRQAPQRDIVPLSVRSVSG
jgi:hypothetical protein